MYIYEICESISVQNFEYVSIYTRRYELKSHPRQRIFRCSLQINMNLVHQLINWSFFRFCPVEKFRLMPACWKGRLWLMRH